MEKFDVVLSMVGHLITKQDTETCTHLKTGRLDFKQVVVASVASEV